MNCANVVNDRSAIPPAQSWPQRQSQLDTIKQWHLTGVMGVRTPQKSLSANLDWEQNGHDYTLRLFGPLGSGSARIVRRNGEVVMTTSKNKRSVARNADELLARETGMRVPVHNLYYWVRGIPAPGELANQTFDRHHRLQLLQQQAWTIQYVRYRKVKGMQLPSKIILQRAPYTVKLIIKRWGLGDSRTN